MNDFILLLPEIFLAITLAGIITSEIGYHGEKIRLLDWTALVGLGGAFAQTLLTYRYGPNEAFGRSISIDGLALFFKLFFIALAVIAIASSAFAKEIATERRAEYNALIIASALSMCIAASATDIILVVLALQSVNVLNYFLAGFSPKSIRSTEAAVKHLIFGAVSGVLLLYGLAILFAATHATNIHDMHRILLMNPPGHQTGLVAFMLIFLSLCFQIGAFPMYLWAPDVLEGAPTPVSGFVSVGTRAVGFAIALRLLFVLFAQPMLSPGQWQVLGTIDWTNIVALVSGLTMIFGSLLAFRQTAGKRLVAYLAVAQTGFLLLGILVLNEAGISALLYNLIVDLFALLGSFYVLSFFFDELQSDRLDDLKGMLARAVPESIALVLFLACLVGLPPLPGFIGKFALIGAALRHHWYFLSLVAIGAIAISTIAIVKLSFSLLRDFELPQAPLRIFKPHRWTILGILFIPMVLVGVFAEVVLKLTGQFLQFIIW